MRNGQVIREIAEVFAEIGYKVNLPFKLHAEDYGVPQKRRRIFIIGTKKNIHIEPPKPLFSETTDFLPKPITVRQSIYGLPHLQSGEGAFEMEADNSATSAYEKMIMNEIDFEEFYYLVKSESQKVKKVFTMLQPTLFPTLA